MNIVIRNIEFYQKQWIEFLMAKPIVQNIFKWYKFFTKTHITVSYYMNYTKLDELLLNGNVSLFSQKHVGEVDMLFTW